MKSLSYLFATFLCAGIIIHAPVVWADEVMSAEDIIKALNNKLVVVPRPKVEETPTVAGQPAVPSAPDNLSGLAQLDFTIQFALNSDAIETASFPVLMNLSQAIADPRMGSQRILVGGHTDARGTDDRNMLLSQRRAVAVKQFLSSVRPEISGRLDAVGFGESRLKNQADPEAAENRRVQIVNLGQ